VKSPTVDWKCDACINKPREAVCHRCVLRGGALKKDTHKRWTHVVCDKFAQVEDYHQEKTCSVCELSSNSPGELVLKCAFGNCVAASHVTCAMISGMSASLQDGSLNCLRHTKRGSFPQKFKIGDKLLVLSDGNGKRNPSKSQVLVLSLKEEMVYEVMFDDGSLCYNLLRQYIVDPVDGPVHTGQSVVVKWSDSLQYSAKTLGAHCTFVYEVQFKSGNCEFVLEADLTDPLAL
jgi:hypothetical protein